MVKQIENILHNRSIPFISYENEWPSLIDENHSQVWVVGGDGTLSYYLNKYDLHKLPMTIFPGGTGNDVHWKIYDTISVEDQIAKVLEGSDYPVDYGICNGRKFVNCVGIGFDGEVLKNMGFIRSLGGFMGYYVAIIKTIFKYKEPNYVIEYDGKRIEQKFMILNVANSSRTGGGILVSPKALINDQLLNLVTVDKLSILKRLRVLPMAEKGKHLSLPFVNHDFIKEVKIECERE